MVIDIEIVQTCIFFQLALVLSIVFCEIVIGKTAPGVLNVSVISTSIVSIQSVIIALSLFEGCTACIIISCPVTICTYLVTRGVINKFNKKHGNKPIVPERTETIEKYKNCKVYDASGEGVNSKIIRGERINDFEIAHEIIKRASPIRGFKIVSLQGVYVDGEYIDTVSQSGEKLRLGIQWESYQHKTFKDSVCIHNFDEYSTLVKIKLED